MRIKKYVKWAILIIEISIIIFLLNNLNELREIISPKASVILEEIRFVPTEKVIPTVMPTLEPTKKIIKLPTPTPDNEPWGGG